jgi:hypothetical protein
MSLRNINGIKVGGINELQSKIILMRGFIPEEELLTQKEISLVLKRPSSSINYNIKELRKKGLLTQLNYLTPDGKVVFLKIKVYHNNTKKLRAHKISGKFILKEPYRDFEEVRDKYIKISNGKYFGFKLEVKDCTILFYTSNKICFILSSVYGDSIEEIFASAYETYIHPLKNHLEQIFESLKINNYEIASIQMNHFALQHHPLAEVFKEFNVNYSSDRLEVDHSHGVAELETVHKKHSVEDMDKILDYEKVVRGSFSCNNGYSKIK